jgi:hypothetical protein
MHALQPAWFIMLSASAIAGRAKMAVNNLGLKFLTITLWFKRSGNKVVTLLYHLLKSIRLPTIMQTQTWSLQTLSTIMNHDLINGFIRSWLIYSLSTFLLILLGWGIIKYISFKKSVEHFLLNENRDLNNDRRKLNWETFNVAFS